MQSFETFDEEGVIGLVPGPTSVPKQILAAWSKNYGSPDMEEKFFELYSKVQKQLSQTLHCKDETVTILSGEGMVALWAALKSVLIPGDRVLAVANGLFGDGIGSMAADMKADVKYVRSEWTRAPNVSEIRKLATEFRPKLITAVHCETPSGFLTPLEEIGKIAKEVGALFYVDFVASAYGAQVKVHDWNIDLGLLGTQKALSVPPVLSVVTVSPKAWKIIEEVNYDGYDALKPFEHAIEKKYFPYTHNWHGIAALGVSLDLLISEGLDHVFKRHEEVADYTRKRLVSFGIKLYPETHFAPTVTAAWLPDNWSWEQFSNETRKHKLIVGGNYGKLKGKVFRIGHMGSQANMDLVKRGLDVLELIFQKTKPTYNS